MVTALTLPDVPRPSPPPWVVVVLVMCSWIVGSSAASIGLAFLDSQSTAMSWWSCLRFAVVWSVTTALVAHGVLEGVSSCCRCTRWTSRQDACLCEVDDTIDGEYHLLQSDDTDNVEEDVETFDTETRSATIVALYVGGTFLSFTATCGLHDATMWHTFSHHGCLVGLVVATGVVTLVRLAVTGPVQLPGPSPTKHLDSMCISQPEDV